MVKCNLPKLLFFWSIFTFCLSCQNSGNSNKANDENTDSVVANPEPAQKDPEIGNQELIIIHGKDIWIRDLPVTGQVVMKLNEGDECKIIDKSEMMFVKNLPDYWYKIDFNGKQGWVFGSQTSMSLFTPLNEPIIGSLTVCEDDIVKLSETPPSFSYTFNKDGNFTFSVAAGYNITGKYLWNENHLTLNPSSLIMSTPDGNQVKQVTGKIVFNVCRKANIICLSGFENKFSDKDYSPKPGCFCLE
ncbi:MAG: hypothetical protein U0W24_10710 [Bacteroidales bacterium]